MMQDNLGVWVSGLTLGRLSKQTQLRLSFSLTWMAQLLSSQSQLMTDMMCSLLRAKVISEFS